MRTGLLFCETQYDNPSSIRHISHHVILIMHLPEQGVSDMSGVETERRRKKENGCKVVNRPLTLFSLHARVEVELPMMVACLGFKERLVDRSPPQPSFSSSPFVLRIFQNLPPLQWVIYSLFANLILLAHVSCYFHRHDDQRFCGS